jgi:uncharacterized protein (UPF0262 family)
MSEDAFRISAVALDRRVGGRLRAGLAVERDAAIHDLLTENHFRPIGSPGGPYHLTIGVEDNRLVLNLFLENGTPHGTAFLSISPYRRIILDYFRLCDSFGLAEGGGCGPDRIEALDMARRSLHDEGAKLLRERLAGKVEMDLDTARGIFSLICLLHLQG